MTGNGKVLSPVKWGQYAWMKVLRWVRVSTVWGPGGSVWWRWIPEVHFQDLTARGQWGLGTYPGHPWQQGCPGKAAHLLRPGVQSGQ